MCENVVNRKSYKNFGKKQNFINCTMKSLTLGNEARWDRNLNVTFIHGVKVCYSYRSVFFLFLSPGNFHNLINVSSWMNFMILFDDILSFVAEKLFCRPIFWNNFEYLKLQGIHRQIVDVRIWAISKHIKFIFDNNTFNQPSQLKHIFIQTN